MSLKEQVRQSLGGVALFQYSTQLVEATDGDRHLRCELVALDSLACAFERLSLKSEAISGVSIDRLKKIAERLASQLTYLLEPISPIEIDSQGCTVQMRSNPPQKEADRTTYYELLVQHSGELSLCRYSRTAGSDRAVVPAEVTREVLLRLVGDFESVV